MGAAEIGEQPKPSVCPPMRLGWRRRVSHMPCHCSLGTCAGERAPAMSISLSRSRSSLHCKRRARSISGLRRAAGLLRRRSLRNTCFSASSTGADGTGVGGGSAACLGGGMRRRGAAADLHEEQVHENQDAAGKPCNSNPCTSRLTETCARRRGQRATVVTRCNSNPINQ